MVIFVCENCVDGIFTGVYDAWASHLGHMNAALRMKGPANLELFAEYREVIPDGGKAGKVADTIRRRMGEESYGMIFRAALSNAPERADCIYRVLVSGLSRHTDPWESRHILEKLQDANVYRIFELSRKVWEEAHRYEGFVRFREIEGGILFSEIEAENQVLPLIGGHFADRFPNENFMIYDHHSEDCLVHAAQKRWFIWRKACFEKEMTEKYRTGEEEIQHLWRGFCDSVSIRERENPRLQLQFWPIKFRKWMTEGRMEPEI